MKVNPGGSKTCAERILQMARRHRGTVTTAQITEAGISRGHLQPLMDRGRLVRTARGVYVLPDMPEDEFLALQSRCKRGVFSLGTALFLHGLTDRTPGRLCMTFPENYNTTRLRDGKIRFVRVRDALHEMGVEEVRTPAGNRVRAYSPERTLCDILKGTSRTDAQIISDAFKRYVRRRKRNLPQLSAYAKRLRVERRVQSRLEALL